MYDVGVCIVKIAKQYNFVQIIEIAIYLSLVVEVSGYQVISLNLFRFMQSTG